MTTMPIGFWPTAVIEDRYGGAYSKGRWLAIACADEYVPVQGMGDDVSRVQWCLEEGPYASDIEAMEFWANPPKWIAAGRSPDLAVIALRGKAQ